MSRFLLTSLLITMFATTAFAHKVWLRPSQTVLSGAEPWITVDAAVSNDLFYFNHFPLRLDGLVITAPDGSGVEADNGATGKYRSVFDLSLNQRGTYRIAIVNHGAFASWEEGGERRRWRGSAAEIADAIPAAAENLQVTESLSRIETFVTNGAPTETALQPVGKGVELVPVTHPNDLYAGETCKLRLLVNGKPQSDLHVTVIRGETRYRNQQDELRFTTDERGEFSVTWPESGMYWLETSSEDNATSISHAERRRMSYTATLEVLPQ
ncbi:DUF4198 domain-containing protein [Novipirellula sp.]|uniref:DUF4198 domain-containing protein n=1 Tax=Novipirellula sp. TaxID=2795430 RepID=UPI0035649139